MSYLTALGTANPQHGVAQKTIADFMVRAMALEEEDARKLHTLFRATGIETRYSVIADYGRENGFDFFPDNESLTPFPSTKQRLEFFKKHALGLSLASISRCLEQIPALKKSEITHLIVVSCTGMYAPGLDIDLINALGLNAGVSRTCINFMGCYAAFNAIKLADALCRGDKNARVLVVCTELCSLHFQKENTENNMLANALFADGSAAVLVEAIPRKGMNLKPAGFHCDLAPEGQQDMAWKVGDWGFEMKLSADVPDIIRSGIKKLTQSLLQKICLDLSSVSYFAIHPGGKKILEVIEQELNIGKESNQPAYETLSRYGNMSSPTVLFVLNEVFKKLSATDQNKTILSFAFGPGLTLESMLLEVENH